MCECVSVFAALHLCLCSCFVFSVSGYDCIFVSEGGAGQDLPMFGKRNKAFPNSSLITLCKYRKDGRQPLYQSLNLINLLHHGLILLEWWAFEALAVSRYRGCGPRCNTALFESNNNGVLQSVSLIAPGFSCPPQNDGLYLAMAVNVPAFVPFPLKGNGTKALKHTHLTNLAGETRLTCFALCVSVCLCALRLMPAVLPHCVIWVLICPTGNVN